MQVQQQFVLVRHDDEGVIDVTTTRVQGDAMQARENEILVRDWMAFAPAGFGRALVHVPLLDEGQDRTRAHLVGLATARGDAVAIHLLRLDPEAYALIGDDPFRPWRHGVLLEDWNDATETPPFEPMACGDGLSTGLRAIFPEQYAVLEALLRRALADEHFVLPSATDDPAVEDLFEHLVHVMPRGLRRRQSLSTFVTGVEATFDLSAQPRDGASLRAGLRQLLAEPAPALSPELDGYVELIFSFLRAKDFDNARATIDAFGRSTAVDPTAEDAAVEAEVEAVAELVDDVVERVHDPDDRDEADRTLDVVEDVSAVAPSMPASAVAVEEPEDSAEVDAPSPWEDVVLDGEEDAPRRRGGVVAVVVLLLLAAGGFGAVHFGWIDVDALLNGDAATVVDEPLAVPPQASLAAFRRAQNEALIAHVASQPPIFELRQTLAAHRTRFEADARAAWAAQKDALDARIATVLASAAGTDSTVASALRVEVEALADELPRLRAQHVGITAGRPELLDASDGEGRSSLVDGFVAWSDDLTAWAARFDALAAGDLAAPWPETKPPTPGLEALAAYQARAAAFDGAGDDTARQAALAAAATVKRIWGELPFALRDRVGARPELTVDDVAEPNAQASR